jgi:hypothetical protein
MRTEMVASERLDVHRPPMPATVLKELTAARQLINRLAYSAYDKLDGEEMYDLAAAEGMLAGAISKIEAATS